MEASSQFAMAVATMVSELLSIIKCWSRHQMPDSRRDPQELDLPRVWFSDVVGDVALHVPEWSTWNIIKASEAFKLGKSI